MTTHVQTVADYDHVIIRIMREQLEAMRRELELARTALGERDAIIKVLEDQVEDQTNALLVAEADKAYLAARMRDAQESNARLMRALTEKN